MEKVCKLQVLDEVNVRFCGVLRKDIDLAIKRTELFVKGAHQTAAYQAKIWNGKESLLLKDGHTLFYMIDEVGGVLEELGYRIEIEDRRKQGGYQPEAIKMDSYEEFGVTLRPGQVEAINAAIEKEKGIIESPTASGKSLITAGIVKAYDPAYRSIVIVPSEFLADQTQKELQRFGLDVGVIHGKIVGKAKKEKEWAKRHVVATWQTLHRNRQHLSEFDSVFVDESHVMGDVLYSLLRGDLKHARIRVGLTATMPKKDRQKFQKICAHIGDSIIMSADSAEMMKEGYIAQVNIILHGIDYEPEYIDTSSDLYEWTTEKRVLDKDVHRMKAIAEYIEALPMKNTLVLTHRVFGEMLANHMHLSFIDQQVTGADRKRLMKGFDDRDDYRLIATFGTVGTGVSVNDIYQLVLIDAGKNEVSTIQGIGRGLRKDSQGINFCQVYDLYSKLPFSIRHATERKAIYKKYRYPFSIGNTISIDIRENT